MFPNSSVRGSIRAVLGATAGQGVIWYTGQFFALFYLQTILKVNPKQASILVAIALLIAMPFFTIFGSLSDRIGRNHNPASLLSGTPRASLCVNSTPACSSPARIVQIPPGPWAETGTVPGR